MEKWEKPGREHAAHSDSHSFHSGKQAHITALADMETCLMKVTEKMKKEIMKNVISLREGLLNRRIIK